MAQRNDTDRKNKGKPVKPGPTLVGLAAAVCGIIAVAAIAAAIIFGMVSFGRNKQPVAATAAETATDAQAGAAKTTTPPGATAEAIGARSTEEERLRGEAAAIDQNTASVSAAALGFAAELAYAPGTGEYGQAPYLARYMTDEGIVSLLSIYGKENPGKEAIAGIRDMDANAENEVIHIVTKKCYVEPVVLRDDQETCGCILVLDCSPVNNLYGTPTYTIFMELQLAKQDGKWLVSFIDRYSQL